MSDTIYCGNGRIFKGKFGDIPKFSFSKKDINTMVDFMNKNKLEWINCEMLEKKNKEDKKPTHYIKIDEYKPNTQSIIKNAPSKKSDIEYYNSGVTEDDLPF